MRLTYLLCMAAIGTSLCVGQQQFPSASSPALDDRYSVAAVSASLQFLQRGGSSWDIKQYIWPLQTLGDRVSVAVLRIYTADELVQTENASAYLVVARNAFSSRSSVLEKPDIDPKVTLFVLEYLREKESSHPALLKRIDYLKGCIKDFTCSSQAEYDYLHKQ
jgi:hypothetical protein